MKSWLRKIFGWLRHKKNDGILLRSIAHPIPPANKCPSNPFRAGDIVTMLGANPYKGCIRAGVNYRVRYSGYDQILLMGDHGTQGWFMARCFSLADGLPRANISYRVTKHNVKDRKRRRKNREAHRQAFIEEYEEIIKAQDSLEIVKNDE